MSSTLTAKWDWKSLKEQWILYLFVFSAFAGSGISYGSIYLFHFAFPLALMNVLVKNRSIKPLLNRTFFPIHLLYGLILFISVLNDVNFSFLYYYFVSYGVFIVLLLYVDLIRSNLRSIVLFVAVLVGLDVLIGGLEVLTDFRYPISNLSRLNYVFGRDHDFLATYDGCFNLRYATSCPTGFHWNPNNYALVLLMSLPFTAFLENQLFRNMARILIFLLILSTGSRIGIYSAAFILVVLLVSEWREISLKSLIVILPLVFMFTDGFYFMPLHSYKIKEIALVSKSQFVNEFPEHCQKKAKSNESRMALMRSGLDYWKTQPVFGRGAGSLTAFYAEQNKQSQIIEGKTVTVSPHNFILEVMVDFGLIVLLPIGWFLVCAFKASRKLNSEQKMVLLLFVIAIGSGTIMVSSLVYFLPFYLFLFLTAISLLFSDTTSLQNTP
jgi:hypothetical protein